jgi:hypothetical protein
MNWLERARCEIQESAQQRTANSAERNLTAVMAVPPPALRQKLEGAAMAEFDGGLSRDKAEREAWVLVSKRYRAALRVKALAANRI